MDMVECDDIRIKLRKSYKEKRGQSMFMINLIENLQTLQKFASLGLKISQGGLESRSSSAQVINFLQ